MIDAVDEQPAAESVPLENCGFRPGSQCLPVSAGEHHDVEAEVGPPVLAQTGREKAAGEVAAAVARSACGAGVEGPGVGSVECFTHQDAGPVVGLVVLHFAIASQNRWRAGDAQLEHEGAIGLHGGHQRDEELDVLLLSCGASERKGGGQVVALVVGVVFGGEVKVPGHGDFLAVDSAHFDRHISRGGQGAAHRGDGEGGAGLGDVGIPVELVLRKQRWP